MAFSVPIPSVESEENHYSNREVDELDEQKVNFKSQPNKEKLIMDPPCSSYRDLYSITAKSVDLTRDLGSILRPSQDKSLLVISIIRKRLGLNRIVGNFDGNHPFFLYERPSRAHVVSTREALRARKARQRGRC